MHILKTVEKSKLKRYQIKYLKSKGRIKMSAPKLFSPGPIMVKENVRAALAHYDICHRGAEFEELFARATEKINKLFKADPHLLKK